MAQLSVDDGGSGEEEESGGDSFGVGDAASIAGAGLAAYGAYSQGQDNAYIARYNAQIADQSAAQVTAMGQEDARRSLVNSYKVLSGGKAAYGASGVSGGSTNDVLRAGASQGELNALTIQYNANVKANAFTNEGNLDRYRAGNDETAGDVGAASDVLKGVGTVAAVAALFI